MRVTLFYFLYYMLNAGPFASMKMFHRGPIKRLARIIFNYHASLCDITITPIIYSRIISYYSWV